MRYTDTVRATQSELIYLVRAPEKPSGNPAWYYVRVHSKSKLPLFLEKVKTGHLLTEYAEVLYCGWGDDPPPEIKQKIEEQFG